MQIVNVNVKPVGWLHSPVFVTVTLQGTGLLQVTSHVSQVFDLGLQSLDLKGTLVTDLVTGLDLVSSFWLSFQTDLPLYYGGFFFF